ncbi:hypothetical protein JW879_07085 [candidate division WOR-3 bacterium]|nr:hypothetical protein [candidate division WOR-3 bacterium]
MLKKLNSVVFPLLNKMSTKKIEFPLENLNTIALRPSEIKGETLYSLPLVESLSKKHKLSVLLPDNQDVKYFRRLRAKIIRYPAKSGPIGMYRLRNNIKDSYDLFIDLNETDIQVFSYLLKNPIVASINEVPGVNITARTHKKSITGKYQYLIDLLGFPALKWKTKALRARRSSKKREKEEIIGISSDISTQYHGLHRVSDEDGLRKVTTLITKRNDLSAIAFLLEIPQVLLLEEKDPFQPPDAIKVVRYSRKITPKIIGDCLVT